MDGDIPDLYVQSSKYWLKYANHIKALFSYGIVSIDRVALHVRRGDYVGNSFYVDLWETDYYRQAIAQFPADTRFMVFCRDNQSWDTDKADRQWCRDNLTPILGDRFELPSKDNSETDDLNLMAGCSSIIMANSSFSWWAAFLGNHAKVICPRAWYSDGLQRTEPMEDWTLI